MTKDYKERARKVYRSRLRKLGYKVYSRTIPKEYFAKLDEVLNKLKKGKDDDQ